jgi:AcrR family transcriptional regulator
MPPKRTGSTIKGDERQTALLGALVELLAQRPLHDLGIGEIAARAGLTRSAFYFYFPNKTAAVAHLLEGLGSGILDAASDAFAVDDEIPPRERIRLGAERGIAVWRKDAPLYGAIIDATAVDQELATAWDKLVDDLTAIVTPRARADRTARADLDVADIHGIVTYLLDAGIAAMRRDIRAIRDTGQPTPDLVETTTEIWVRTLYGEP